RAHRASRAARTPAIASAPGLSVDGSVSLQSLQEMIADAQGVRHDRQGGIDRRTGHKEAAVNDVEVIQIVRLAVHVQHGSRRVVAEADRAALMRDTRNGYLLAQV